jgi:uncharacterized protein involved in outer membrane biogenesis
LVESSTGRELRVGGDLAIKLLPVPSMEANDVTFANAPRASQSHMVQAKRVRAELALLPLLKGRMVVERFVAIEPEVFLETDADGRGNWQFGEEGASSAEAGVASGAPSEELDVIVSQVRIESARLDYLDGKTKKKTILVVDELTIGTERPSGRVALSLRAAYQDLPVTLDGTFGAVGAILRNQPIEVDMEGTLGEAGFTVQGTVGKPLHGRDLRLDVAFASKSTRSMTELTGIEFEDIGPVNLTLTLLEQGGVYDLDDIKVTARPRYAEVAIKGSVLDVSDLSGSATVDTSGERPRASAKLRASVIDLAALALPADKSETGTAVEKPSDGRVIPDTLLPLDALNITNGDIEFAVDRLITPRLTLDKVDVVARLDNGNLSVKSAAHIAGGTVSGTIDIEARMQPAKFTLDVDAKKISIGALTKELRGYETGKGLDSNLKMKLRGQGGSLRALMGGLDGDIRLEIGEGSLNNDVLDRVGADLLTQIIGVAVPTGEKDEVTTVKCGVVRFAVKDGDAIADKTLVLETEKVLFIGGGLIDLKTEDLDLGAELAARKGSHIGAGTLSSLVRVQGTLAEPHLGTDLAGVVKTGAKVGIAVATVGLSLIAESVYGQISEDDYPCQTALARQIEATPAQYRAQSTSEEN